MQKYFEKIYSTILYDDTAYLESSFLFKKEEINDAKLEEKRFLTITKEDHEFSMIFKKNQETINCLLIMLDNGKKLLDEIKKERIIISKINKIPDNYLWFKSNIVHEEIFFDKKDKL